MRLTITARHIQLPPLLEDLLRSKVEKLEKFGHQLLSAHAIFGKERYFFTAELTLSIKGLTLVGKAKDRADILTCMEEALHKLKEQLHRHESKRLERLRRLARMRRIA